MSGMVLTTHNSKFYELEYKKKYEHESIKNVYIHTCGPKCVWGSALFYLGRNWCFGSLSRGAESCRCFIVCLELSICSSAVLWLPPTACWCLLAFSLHAGVQSFQGPGAAAYGSQNPSWFGSLTKSSLLMSTSPSKQWPPLLSAVPLHNLLRGPMP